MKILVVDDMEENRYFIEALLKGDKNEVHSVANGVEALDKLQAEKFNLIISDILMPEMDGFQLCQKVKSDKQLCYIPFLVYTATYTSPEDEAFAMRIGADRFLQKPCEPDILLEVIHDLLDSTGRCDITPVPEPEQSPKKEFFKLYSERLVEKLEKKMLDLEKETRELREAKKALSISEKKYRRLHESMMDGYVCLDMQGDIIESNDSFRSMLGYTEEELFNKAFLELIPETGQRDNLDIISKEVLAKGYSEVYETEYIRKDGSIIPVEIRIFLLRNDAGEQKGMWAIVRGISKRKELEKNLQQACKIEAIGTLAGGIAHDFNNILSGIFGYAQLTEMNCDNPESVKKNISQLVKGARRASELVQQILTFSRKVEHKKQSLKPYLIVKEALKLLRSSIPQTIEIKEQIHTRKDILADATQVYQVVINLCTNAYQAMEDTGGRLTVSLSDKTESGPGDSNRITQSFRTYILLEIADTGYGMDQKTMDRIFDPYFTTKDVGQGTGLGLALVNGIVKDHKGFIRVSSEPGRGSVFQVFWPAIENVKGKDPVAETGTEDRLQGTEKIMLVEDEQDTRAVTQAILEKLGYHVTSFEEGPAALEAFEIDPDGFDFIITDMSMPKMRGDILSRKILAIRKDIPVILCTGFHETVTKKDALQIGIRRYVQKPVTGKDLAHIIREVMVSRGGKD
ncbi:MAG: response regulator [Proteobacteria bacterium]|nr:response regulator [Pseudomonadota bacterium]MBU1581913.1 response regulator [Pseudomonadota bacterium]MBU2456185.1 response regulator [Pseudomonadota bacterium]MBU2631869.1 response regulator [Pseudomonadota bacterium]